MEETLVEDVQEGRRRYRWYTGEDPCKWRKREEKRGKKTREEQSSKIQRREKEM